MELVLLSSSFYLNQKITWFLFIFSIDRAAQTSLHVMNLRQFYGENFLTVFEIRMNTLCIHHTAGDVF